MPNRRIGCAVLIALITVAACSGNARADENKYKKVVDKNASALVTVKFVLKRSGAGGNSEDESEFTGLMIDSNGLVLCAGIRLGTSKFMRRFGTTTPTQIKVLIGDDTEGVDAELLTSDLELDLSWVQIKKPDAKGYPHVDFSKAAKAKSGQTLLMITRMPKFFDRTPIVHEGRLGGRTSKPRELLVPTGGLQPDLSLAGMPVFAVDGAPVGVFVFQSPDPEDMAAGGRALRNATRTLILPSTEVFKATEQAKKAAKTGEEEEEEEEEE